MDDKEQVKEEEKTVTPAPTEDDGVRQEKDEDQFDKASKVVSELKIENEKREKHIEELKKIETRQIMSGKGQVTPPPAPTLSPAEQASQERIKAVGNATGANWAKAMDGKLE